MFDVVLESVDTEVVSVNDVLDSNVTNDVTVNVISCDVTDDVAVVGADVTLLVAAAVDDCWVLVVSGDVVLDGSVVWDAVDDALVDAVAIDVVEATVVSDELFADVVGVLTVIVVSSEWLSVVAIVFSLDFVSTDSEVPSESVV